MGVQILKMAKYTTEFIVPLFCFFFPLTFVTSQGLVMSGISSVLSLSRRCCASLIDYTMLSVLIDYGNCGADVPKPLSLPSALTVLSLILQLDYQKVVCVSSQWGDGIFTHQL